MNIFNQNYRKSYNNPYRTGVLVGNFVEDVIGQDLKQKYEQEVPAVDINLALKNTNSFVANVNLPKNNISEFSDKYRWPDNKENGLDNTKGGGQSNLVKNYISEAQDQYQWPELKEKHIRENGNDLTLTCNSNFDLNINFSKKNVEDYMKINEKNLYELNDKNLFLPSQIKSETQTQKLLNASNGVYFVPNDINKETQNKLKDFHQKDTRSLLFTKKAGLAKNLFFGHGEQKNFEKNEYASTYHLTMNQKEKTDKIYNSKFKVAEPFFETAKLEHDKSDWGFRKYRKYDEFTKTFDKTTNLEK